MAALHPTEDPGDGSKIFKVTALAAASGTRANAGMLEFVDRRGLLEIKDDVGIVADVAAAERGCPFRHCIPPFPPPPPAFTRSPARPHTRLYHTRHIQSHLHFPTT